MNFHPLIAWLSYAAPLWLIPAIAAAAGAYLVQWKSHDPIYVKELFKVVALGIIAGYVSNKVCRIYEAEKAITIWAIGTSFFAQWIGIALLKNKWTIIKANTGIDGSKGKSKE